MIDDINKETELMRVEEIVTKTCVLELKKAHEQRQLIAQQALLVETAKLAGERTLTLILHTVCTTHSC